MSATDRKLTMAELGRCSEEQYRHRPKHPVVILLEDIRSGHNVGSVFRTADAFAIEKVMLVGRTAHPPHREIEKTALGSTRNVPWEAFSTPEEAEESLRSDGCKMIAVEQTMQAIPLQDLDLTSERAVFVFGNEVRGVSGTLLDLCDASVCIPQFGIKHSLNVAVCAGMVLWHILRGKAPS